MTAWPFAITSPGQHGRDLQIEEELTDFHFAQDGQGYPLVLQNYQSASEDDSRPASSVR